MKFTIEIYTMAADDSEWIIHRTVVTAISPLAARKVASTLLAARKKAIGARIMNAAGDIVYTIQK